MNEQPSRAERSAQNLITPQKSALKALFLFLRFLVAFLIGWLAPWLLLQRYYPIPPQLIYTYFFLIIILIFPLIIGIGVPFTIGRQSRHLVALSTVIGLLVMAGVAAYGFPITIPADAQLSALCAVQECHVGPINTPLLTFYLVYGVVLILISTGITGLIIKRIRKNRQKTSYYRPSTRVD